MTNPTLPLTAEDLAKRLEAYAAQQNAELVATISQLNSDIAGLKAQLKDAEINFKALADGTIRDEAIGMLRAENERLKQQLASNFERRPIMTNDQQAYDRAMAHNAMLREALILQTEVISSYDVMEKSVKALNATEADATAWEKKLRQDVMLAVHPLQPEYEKLQQQLATVTVERDALRDLLGNFEEQCIIRPTDGGWVVDTIGLELWMDKRNETLNQSPPSE